MLSFKTQHTAQIRKPRDYNTRLMAIKRYLIHYLLALCIGLFPVLNASAMSAGHSTTAPMDCLDCGQLDMNHGNPCHDQGCTSITQSCQSPAGTTCLPATTAFQIAPLGQSSILDRSDSFRLQDITDSIYRPPIT